MSDTLDIRAELEGRVVLVTGGTGFLGQVLTEKLFRSVKIRHLYLLVRTKKGLPPQQRLDGIFNGPIFSVLQKCDPKFRDRVSAVCGDCALPGLGLNLQDRDLLRNEVEVIIHSAATVKFDEHIRIAYEINIRGTQEVMRLAEETKNIKCVVHISTAFSNCVFHRVEERLYEAPMEHSKLANLVQSLDDSFLTDITPRMLGKWPNTYTFTKAIAEHVVAETHSSIPTIIFRPSIVLSTAREPIPGWSDNLYGPTGLSMATSYGLVRIFFGNKNSRADMVPVDMVVAAIITSAASLIKDRPKELQVLNYAAGQENSLKWQQLKELTQKQAFKVPMNAAIWYTDFRSTSSWWWYKVNVLFLHYLPAIIIDSLCKITGKKIKLSFREVYRKIDRMAEVLSFFTTQEWDFEMRHMRQLEERLSPDLRKEYPTRISSLDWEEYTKDYINGIRRYLAKEDPSTIPAALAKQRKFEIAHNTLKGVLTLFLVYLLYTLLSYLYL